MIDLASDSESETEENDEQIQQNDEENGQEDSFLTNDYLEDNDDLQLSYNKSRKTRKADGTPKEPPFYYEKTQ